jgi:signal transduction histidine kinase
VEEVFANLLGNAIMYMGADNQEAHISVKGVVVGSMTRYEVEDNGLGLPPEAQQEVYTPFTRFHEESARGSGLGLSIVRRIVEKLGGEVGVESDVGKGSLFYFTLPATNA